APSGAAGATVMLRRIGKLAASPTAAITITPAMESRQRDAAGTPLALARTRPGTAGAGGAGSTLTATRRRLAPSGRVSDVPAAGGSAPWSSAGCSSASSTTRTGCLRTGSSPPRGAFTWPLRSPSRRRDARRCRRGREAREQRARWSLAVKAHGRGCEGAVDDAALVGVGERVGELARNVERVGGSERLSIAKDAVQRLGVDEAFDQIVP